MRLSGLAIACCPAFALIFMPSTARASPGASCSGSAVDVSVEDLKDRSGRLFIELYPATEADFLKDKDKLVAEGKTFRRDVAPIPAQGPVQLCMTAPGPGRYALIIIHDRDGRDKFSIGKDGLGLPIARSLGSARPRVSQATVTFASVPLSLRIRMQYLKGLKGFVLSGG
ncbi:DUF2141 domain-containing protein [Sphingobium yanoikuyae]|uniref:DUF2141 domain-containing protein n=1 Tax=Sphingobium yanoikuyae TaxID=13690 RepID=UPI00241D73AF|nr:DUF2141 domain-containing protein [Sphingobium yanoikuyae]